MKNNKKEISEDLFELVELQDENTYSIRLISGPYTGIQYKYNKCSLSEEEDNATLHFEYDIIEDIKPGYDNKEFEHYIGNILVFLIEEYMEESKVIYSGGEGEIEKDEVITE